VGGEGHNEVLSCEEYPFKSATGRQEATAPNHTRAEAGWRAVGESFSGQRWVLR